MGLDQHVSEYVMTVFIYGWTLYLIWYVKPNVLSKSLWCHLNTSTSFFEVKPQKNRENKPSVSVNSCYLLAVNHRIALQSVEWPFCGHNMSRPALCARFQRCQALLHAGKIERVRVMGGTMSLSHTCVCLGFGTRRLPARCQTGASLLFHTSSFWN